MCNSPRQPHLRPDPKIEAIMLRTGILALSLALVATQAHAQGWIELERPRLPNNPPSITRTGSEVQATIEGRSNELIAMATGEPVRPATLVEWDDKGRVNVQPA